MPESRVRPTYPRPGELLGGSGVPALPWQVAAVSPGPEIRRFGTAPRGGTVTILLGRLVSDDQWRDVTALSARRIPPVGTAEREDGRIRCEMTRTADLRSRRLIGLRPPHQPAATLRVAPTCSAARSHR